MSPWKYEIAFFERSSDGRTVDSLMIAAEIDPGGLISALLRSRSTRTGCHPYLIE